MDPSVECRVCYRAESAEDRFISPCLCSGSVAFIHESCFEKMLAYNSQHVFKCPICAYRHEHDCLLPSALWFALDAAGVIYFYVLLGLHYVGALALLTILWIPVLFRVKNRSLCLLRTWNLVVEKVASLAIAAIKRICKLSLRKNAIKGDRRWHLDEVLEGRVHTMIASKAAVEEVVESMGRFFGTALDASQQSQTADDLVDFFGRRGYDVEHIRGFVAHIANLQGHLQVVLGD
ncbi:hypothetical protein QR680_012382 [Steinernema hermaphroditum]|uniref:RING-CH-type domain-containing protein n=1 Tax=Steinernema hermaphroditum TaxID=289476 RepID=A0AA39I1W0_9BILA|nr:hypothetical protein QR680_012382 [Steinernema hermaphroditum]